MFDDQNYHIVEGKECRLNSFFVPNSYTYRSFLGFCSMKQLNTGISTVNLHLLLVRLAISNLSGYHKSSLVTHFACEQAP